MAIIQLGSTKSANALINYADDRRAIERSGVNCDVDMAKEQFKFTRDYFHKNNGIQAFHVIQSFKPDEIDSQKANEIGLELAELIAPKHECIVCTHTDKNHIHNHIIINSINFESGLKYNNNNKKLYEIRDNSDSLCKKNQISVIKENNAKVRYTLAEKRIVEKGKISWKDEIRKAVDRQKIQSKNQTDFKNRMLENENIYVKSTKKTMTFENENGMKVRAKKLGQNYEKEHLSDEFGKSLEREKSRGYKREITGDARRSQELSKSAERFSDSNRDAGKKRDTVTKRNNGFDKREIDGVIEETRINLGRKQYISGGEYNSSVERFEEFEHRSSRKNGANQSAADQQDEHADKQSDKVAGSARREDIKLEQSTRTRHFDLER